MENFYNEAERILKRLDEKTSYLVNKMGTNSKLEKEDVFFDNQEFMLLMKISPRTALEWRNKKIIKFSQVGNKIYYRLTDIKKLLNENYNTK